MGSAVESVQLATQLRTRKRDIATLWLHRSATDWRLHPLGRLPDRELLNGIDALVDFLSTAMNAPALCTPLSMSAAAEKFARTMWELNYAPSQAVLEFGHFRAAIQEILSEFDDASLRRESLEDLSLVFDSLLAHTVGCFSELQRVAQSSLTAAQSESEERRLTLAVVGHELRSALTPVMTLIDVLCRSAKAETAEQKQCIEQACHGLQRSARNLNRVINDLNDFAALERGKLTIRFVALDMRALVSECIDSFDAHAQQAGIHLSAPHCEHALMVQADETRLQQCLLNLLNNGVKFTPAGGEIRVGLYDLNGCAVLEVTDTGLGMLPGELSQIFEPFRQLDGGRKAGGLGLGLAIVKSIVQLHGGKISARSDGHGRGSAFRIEIPKLRA